MLPKITIITPSYNQGAFIEQTIVSVLNQGYENLEYIIIDGGSSDGTVDVLKKYQDRITYWLSEPDNGQAHAINKGLRMATGDVFNWINSDDSLEVGALKTVGKFFNEHQSKNVFCGFTRCFWHETNATEVEYRMGLQSSVIDTITGFHMNQPGTFYKTAIVRELGNVNESLRYVFDVELWFRYLCAFGLSDIGVTKERLAHFRLHGTSKSIGEGFESFEKEQQSIFIDIAKFAGAPDWLLKQMCTRSHSQVYRTAGPWNLRNLDVEKYTAYFAAIYLNTLYLTGQKPEAKEALKLIVENNYFKWNRTFMSLRLKLLFA